MEKSHIIKRDRVHTATSYSNVNQSDVTVRETTYTKKLKHLGCTSDCNYTAASRLTTRFLQTVSIGL